MYHGSDGDPHEIYIVGIEDVADDPNIHKGWKSDATKFGLLDKEYVDELMEDL